MKTTIPTYSSGGRRSLTCLDGPVVVVVVVFRHSFV